MTLLAVLLIIAICAAVYRGAPEPLLAVVLVLIILIALGYVR